MKKILLMICLSATAVLCAAPGHRVAGSGMGGQSGWATDAYPGFDGLDDLPKPERHTPGWFSWWSGPAKATAAEQFAYAKELAENDKVDKACKACDALVREWPAAPEAPDAQLMYAMLLSKSKQDWDGAFEQLDYLLDFYPRACAYSELVEYQYKLVNLLVKEKEERVFFGMFISTRILRQHYEMIVRRAPGAAYVPEAMLKIAALRESDQQYEEAVEVYASIVNKFSGTAVAREAAYLQAKARMWLVRRLAYNRARCKDTVGYLKLTIRQLPDHENIEEMKTWLRELTEYMAEDAFKSAKFYDSRQRTPHAAMAAYENFLQEYPDTTRADEVSRRLDELRETVNARSTAAPISSAEAAEVQPEKKKGE